ncbi:MAG TPA: hypothetical protein VLE74_00810 [Candidatus Saccharimonadales bacterium]|nr:hypothetical protein [Candidatus Saccharimonadales bacterium]
MAQSPFPEANLNFPHLFADITANEVPEPARDAPANAYLEQLEEMYTDPFQVRILEGMWELAGLAGLATDQRQVADPQEAEALYDKLDDMRLGFTVFGAEYAGQAGRLLLRSSQGGVERADLPTSLLIADPEHIPKTPPRTLTRGHERFTDYLEGLLGLSTRTASSEVEKVLDGYRQNKFTYRPNDIFVSYWVIAAALPDAHIPDGVGTLIYETRHSAATEPA